MDQYYKIGKIAGTYGHEGQVVLSHMLGEKTDFSGLKAVFIEQVKNEFLPYFIQEARAKNEQETYLKIEGIGSKEEARKILKKEVWLAAADFAKYSSTAAPIGLLGFTFYNGKEKIGEIEEVFEQQHQILCKVMVSGKEALLPVHDENLQNIDRKNRKIVVNLPEGLLDIYKNI